MVGLSAALADLLAARVTGCCLAPGRLAPCGCSCAPIVVVVASPAAMAGGCVVLLSSAAVRALLRCVALRHASTPKLRRWIIQMVVHPDGWGYYNHIFLWIGVQRKHGGVTRKGTPGASLSH